MASAALTPPTVLTASTLSANLPWLLAQASHVMATEMRAAFDELDVPPRGHCVLSVAATGEYTQKDLVETIGLDKTTMVVTIDELEQLGVAERVPSPTDRRARIIKVTKAGKELVKRGERLAARLQDDVLSALPPSERETFMSALNRLVCERLSTPRECSRAPRRRS